MSKTYKNIMKYFRYINFLVKSNLLLKKLVFPLTKIRKSIIRL